MSTVLKHPWVQRLLPYLFLGMGIALFLGLLLVIGYVIIWGLALAVILFGLGCLRRLFWGRSAQSQAKPPYGVGRIFRGKVSRFTKATRKSEGVTIDHED